MSKNNNFEYLLFAAADECDARQAEEFLNVDDSGFEITAQQQKCMKRMMRKYSKKNGPAARTSKPKWILAVCILSLSILFTACVSIPEIRNAIKNFFLEWYEDFVAIGFGEDSNEDKYPDYDKIMPGDQPNTNKNSSNNSSGDSSEENNIAPPTEILSKAYATYLPDNCRVECIADERYYYSLNFYTSKTITFTLTQNIISCEAAWFDSKTQIIYQIRINGYDAILAEEKDCSNCYTLFWQDKEYEYVIMGVFDNTQELIKIAEGIRT